MNGPIVGLALLIQVVLNSSDQLPASLKARHARTVFQALMDLDLQIVAPAVFEALSQRTRESLTADDKEFTLSVVNVGRLKLKFESPAKSALIIKDRLGKKDAKYIDKLRSTLPEIRGCIKQLIDVFMHAKTDQQ